jgi:ADP-heptose:LPS heptosyltransferase
MMTRYPELFDNSPDVDEVLDDDLLYLALTEKLKGKPLTLSYTRTVENTDMDVPPDCHIIEKMARQIGLGGIISLRPYIYLTRPEKEAGKLVKNQIIIQSSGVAARHFFSTKEWFPERFQQVVNRLKGKFNFVQIGSVKDPALDDVIDLRGKTSLRQCAAILSQSLVFIGLVGAQMHLARAVDCRSVIIYGGRELPSQSGYIANENLVGITPCSPCWRHNSCDLDKECMRKITLDSVGTAVQRQVERKSSELPTQQVEM